VLTSETASTACVQKTHVSTLANRSPRSGPERSQVAVFKVGSSAWGSPVLVRKMFSRMSVG